MSEQDTYDDVNEDGSIAGFDAKFINVNGVRTRYYEEGEDNDETLLLIHGGPWTGTSSANTWVPVLEGLSDYFHVLAPDRLACGMTDNPTDNSPYDWIFTSEVEHVRDFLETLDIGKFHVCGNSRGMAAASWFAVEYPDQVTTVVCVNSNTLAPDVGDYGHRRTVLSQSVPSKADSRAELEAMLRRKAAVWSYNPERSLTDEYIQAQAYMKQRPKARQTNEVMQEGGKERIEREGKFELMDDIREGLREGAISQPILLYWGRHDLTAVLEQGLTLYEMISQGNPNVRMHIVDRAGHLPYRDFPEEFVRNVVTFVDYWKNNQRSMADVRPREYAEYYKSDQDE